MMDKLNDIIRMPYYYVEKCPYCGSYVTGRYIKLHRKADAEWQIDESLKHGELVRTKAELIGANCFCLDCDRDFSAPVKMKMLSISEIKNEKLRRCTNDILGERYNDEYHQKAKGLLGLFANFIGKL